MEWISVKERLPEYDEYVLVYDPSCECAVNRFRVVMLVDVIRGRNSTQLEWSGDFSGIDITHWQPLPNPPQQ